jgi:hypothetical protein
MISAFVMLATATFDVPVLQLLQSLVYCVWNIFGGASLSDSDVGTLSLESYWILFSTYTDNRNLHTGDPVEPTGTFLP